MALLLIGLLLLGFGCSLIFARDAWWTAQKFTNQMQGQVSERSLVWEVAQMGLGVIAIALSIALIWNGIDQMNQPVVPSVCQVATWNADLDRRNIRRDLITGCEAAEKKDYPTALSNFRRAAESMDQEPRVFVHRDLVAKAIRQMDQLVLKTQ